MSCNLSTRYKYNIFSYFIRKYRRIIVSFRKEVMALSASRDMFKRRASRATDLCRKMALMLDQVAGDDRIQHLKTEAMVVIKYYFSMFFFVIPAYIFLYLVFCVIRQYKRRHLKN